MYGPNLRASCRRMEAAGWLRTLSAPFLADEQARVLAEQCAKAIRVLPRVPPIQADEADDRPVELDGRWHLALRGDYVIRLDGTTCLQLWNAAGQVTRRPRWPICWPGAGFTAGQVQELQWHRIRWPQMSQEEADRRELNSLLDELEQRQLYCNREQLTEIVFRRSVNPARAGLNVCSGPDDGRIQVPQSAVP